MAHHRRRLSEPLSFENDLFDSCPSSSSSSVNYCFVPKFPSSTSFNNIFKSRCFSLKLKNLYHNMAHGNANRYDDKGDGDHSVNVAVLPPDAAKKKSGIGSQRRQELEQEVADLQNVLQDEEKVHQVLERALLPQNGRSPLHIPSFLPKKTKELLAELVMVEEEISRLENEIRKIRKVSSQIKEVQANMSAEVISCKQSNGALTSLDKSLVQADNGTKSKAYEEKVALETKPMFFINQAIKGDYSIHGFTDKGKKDDKNDSISKKEGRKISGLQERIPKKSGAIEKQSSPKPPRNSSPRPSISVNPAEKDGQKWQPNKLSEKIMKCLLCIFLRLIRTSRVSEIEKLGNSSRSASSFSRSRSFRFENSLNLNTSLISQKETGQKDPYGIFEIEDSLVRDIGPYKNLVRCTSSSLDLKNISSCLQLLSKLRSLLNNLRDVNLRFLTHHQKLAFWINIYNTCIMNGFLQQGLPSNPEKVIALKNKAVLDIGGNKLNALAIEHFILRQPSTKEEGNKDKEDAVRSIYGLEQSEPNIAFALCSGNRSSPSVRIYTADGVSSELEKSKLEYLQASIVVTGTKRLMIPKLLIENMHDFATDMASLLEWICNQLPSSWSLRKSMAECLKGQSNSREISDIVDIIPYDFEFQYLLPV
ncbi:uncharacterized protein LOC109837505 isoform X1 [Asparagus officinalis]|uniref:uncharacterized protein LOC109837505 isoform X1 n=1 Tax=Asparagus officinalis TaxID=4686 RepID=UPI00098DEE4E|nr:uncharacterized protein LOC109837505 isoform X1 [Asparagus officinalis]